MKSICNCSGVYLGQAGKNKLLRWGLLIGAPLLLLCGSAFLSRAGSNGGLLFLVHNMATSKTSFQEAAKAEKLLRQAAAWNNDNEGAHRGLGWVLAAQGENEEAGTEWLTGGFTAQDFIARGEQARKAKQYEEALAWFERAAEIEPELGDPWYYTGLIYERMEQWEKALEAYARAVEAHAFVAVGRSNLYYRMGLIYQWHLEPRQTDAALTVYETAIEMADFQPLTEVADCHYGRGTILWWRGSDPDKCIVECRRAIELNPKHVSAHILLGVIYYASYKDMAMAESEIHKAIELSPQNKWPYYQLGEIYRQAGRADEAVAMYKQALEIDPEFNVARERLETLRVDE